MTMGSQWLPDARVIRFGPLKKTLCRCEVCAGLKIPFLDSFFLPSSYCALDAPFEWLFLEETVIFGREIIAHEHGSTLSLNATHCARSTKRGSRTICHSAIVIVMKNIIKTLHHIILICMLCIKRNCSACKHVKFSYTAAKWRGRNGAIHTQLDQMDWIGFPYR